MEARTSRKRTALRKRICAAVVAGMLSVACLAAFGCGPGNTAQDRGRKRRRPRRRSRAPWQQAKEAAPNGLAMMKDFTDRNAGYFAPTPDNEQYVNAGNRGCNSCHYDLADIMYAQEPEHIVQFMGFGKRATVQDCLVCHDFHGARSGVYFGDVIHVAHYSDPTFAAKGNCWSCHAMDSAGKLGDYQLVLFEQMEYTPALGGFPDGASAPVRWWCTSRGYETGYRTDVVTEEKPKIDVKTNQDPTLEEDAFVINNYAPSRLTAPTGSSASRA